MDRCGDRLANAPPMPSRAFAAALLILSFGASADVIRIARPVYQPKRAPGVNALESGLDIDADRKPACVGANGQFVDCDIQMKFFGGKVIPNVKVYAVFWGGSVSPEIRSRIGGFYRALTNSQYLDWLNEYSTTLDVQAGSRLGQPGSQQVVGRGTFAGVYTLSTFSRTYADCPDESLTCVRDADIPRELDWQVAHGYLPHPDANTIFMVHFPSTVRVGDPGSSQSCISYCAYHGTYKTAAQLSVAYAVMPDYGHNGCEHGCGVGTVFDNTCSGASHEITEAITDAEVGLTTSEDYPLGWYDTETNSQGEIGDMCNQDHATVGASGQTGCTAGSDGCFTVQQVFSQTVWDADVAHHPSTAACVTTRFASDDFALALSPNALTLTPGASSGPIPIVTTSTSGAALPLVLSITDLPPGLHASIDQTSTTVGDVANLTVTADASTPALRDGVVVVRATGSTTHSAALLVQVVVGANEWTLAVAPSSQVFLPGDVHTFTVSGRVTSGSPELVSLDPVVNGLPPGISASFDTLSFTPGASTATLTLAAAPDAAPAKLTGFGVTGTSASQPAGQVAAGKLQIDGLPTVSFVSPATTTTLSRAVEVRVAATPGANSAIESIVFSVDDGGPLYSPAGDSVAWNTLGLPNGNHTLRVTVLDVDGGQASASLGVVVRNIRPPTVSFSAPAWGGVVSGTVGVTVTATVDAAVTLASVTINDGSTLLGTGRGSPLTVQWDTRTASDGPHNLTATVVDSDGNRVTSSPAQFVTVSNSTASKSGSAAGCSATGGSGTGGMGTWLLLLGAAAAARARRRTRLPGG